MGKEMKQEGSCQGIVQNGSLETKGLKKEQRMLFTFFDVPSNTGEKRNFWIVNCSLLMEKVVRHAENSELRNLGNSV